MPTMSREELIVAIGEGRIAAVTIDTTVFDSKQKDFRHADFRSIAQIKTRKTPILIIDVIASEMMSHLEVEAADTLAGRFTGWFVFRIVDPESTRSSAG